MAGSVSTETKHWTYEEYARLDDGKRYEVVGGGLVMAPSPDTYHQDVSRNTELLLARFVDARKLGRVYYAPLDVILDQEHCFQPDLMFVANDNLGIIKRAGIFGVPDLVVEIVSPSSMENDRYHKRDAYERLGIKEYWIMDPENRTIEVLVNTKQGFELYSFAAQKGTVKSKIIEGFEVPVEAVMQEPPARESER